MYQLYNKYILTQKYLEQCMTLLSSSECETTEDATSEAVSMLPNSPPTGAFHLHKQSEQ